MTDALTRRRLNRATLARQLLLGRQQLPATEAIERLVGLQAQDARPPHVGLWTRIERFRRSELRELLHCRKVIRAPLMRCTLHLMTARDYVRFRSPVQPALSLAMRSALRQRADTLELDELVAIATQFFGAQSRSFKDLRTHLAETWPEGDLQAAAYAVRTHLPVVQVPTDADWGYPGTANFALATRWLGTSLKTDPRPHELVRRYLAAFGPATVADAQTWSGLGALRAVFDELRPELRTFRDEQGQELFDLPEAPRRPRSSRRGRSARPLHRTGRAGLRSQRRELAAQPLTSAARRS